MREISRRSMLSHTYGKRRRKKSVKNRYADMIVNVAAVCVLIILIITIKNAFSGRTGSTGINLDRLAAFAIPAKTLNSLLELSVKYGINFGDMVAVYSLNEDFFPNRTVAQSKEEIEQSFIINYEQIKKRYKEKTLHELSGMFNTLFNEITYFPVAAMPEGDSEEGYIYGDSWGAARSYEGDRTHQGCDILDRGNVRGRLPICSMTAGTIENIGWNELGGYRIGIKSPGGVYYYYAHLDSFAEGLAQGMQISAGQLLGYMGDTGYGKKEGTKGNFPVHLHVGISVETDLSNNELWVNPYPFLRFIEYTKALVY